jgi:outer membrane protein
MKKSKLLVLVLIVVFAGLLLGGCGSSANVGIVDVNKVMTTSPKVKQFQDQLTAKGKAISAELEKDKATMSKADFDKKQQASYAEFMQMKQNMEKQIDDSMKQALTQISKEKNLSVVLYKNGVAQGGTDVTDELIKKMQ